jgi:hypothetical protein
MRNKSILALVVVIGIFMTACPDGSSGTGEEDHIGKTKKFWAVDMATEEPYQLEAQLLAIGSHCKVWMESAQISDERGLNTQLAEGMSWRYDEEIYP